MNPVVTIDTAMGTIQVQVDSASAPSTAENFLRLVSSGAYDGGRFYRTVTQDNQPDDTVRIAVIQGGVPEDFDTTHLPSLALERTEQTGLGHRDGTISMARREPDSGLTEFFICVGDQPELDFGGKRNPDGQGFAAFGRVVDGMDVVRAIHGLPREAQTLAPPVAIERMSVS